MTRTIATQSEAPAAGARATPSPSARPFAARSRNLVLGFVALVLMTAACAPAATGSSSTPIVVGGSAIRVEQGRTYYLRFDHSLAQFGLAPKDLQVNLWVPSGYNASRGDAASTFGLLDARVSDRWQVALSSVMVEQRNTTSASFNTTTTDYSLWSVVKVVVPDDIIPGPYRLRATLQARGGKSVPLAATLDVQPK